MYKKGQFDFIELDEDIIYNPAYWALCILGWIGAIFSYAAITGAKRLRPLLEPITGVIGGQELITQYEMPLIVKGVVLIGILIGVPVALYGFWAWRIR